MTKDEARDAIRAHSQNIEEIGLGRQPLSAEKVDEIENETWKLLDAISAYRDGDLDLQGLRVNRDEINKALDGIGGGFVWTHAPGGDAFWQEVSDRLEAMRDRS